MDGLTDVYGRGNIQMYGGTFGGTAIVSNAPELEAMSDYNVTGAPWYQGAAAANGETYISPVYTNVMTGLPVVTLCRMIPETGSFFAIDIKPSLFEMSSQDIELPEMASYFLVDQEGKLLYCLSSWDYENEEFQRFVDGYREGAVCNRTDHVSENVMGADGEVRNVYFHHMDNGWTGILTIPRNEILSDSNLFRNISIALIEFGLVLIAFQGIREYQSSKREWEYQEYQNAMNSTVRA